jgi:hypothetical protein
MLGFRIFSLWFGFYTLAGWAQLTFESDIVSRLNEEPRIRVFIANNPGVGSHSAALEMCRYLERLGVRSTFEILVEEGPEQKEKMKPLLPQWDTELKSPTRIGNFEVTWLRKGETPTRLRYGLSFDPPRPKDIETFQKLSVDHLFVAQYPDWVLPVGIWRTTPTGGLRFEELPLLRNHSFPTLAKPAAVYSNSILKDLLGAYRYMPVYSHRIRSDRILQIATSLREDFAPGNPDTHLVLPIIALNTMARTRIKNAFASLGNSGTRSDLKNIYFASTEPDATELERITAFKKTGGILILCVPGAEENEFQKMMLESPLPPVIEGKSTERLLQSYGVPYMIQGRNLAFRMFRSNTPNPAVKLWQDAFLGDESESMPEWAVQKFIGGQGALESFIATDKRNKIREFVRAARKPESELRGFFSGLQKQIQDPKQSMILRGLEILFSKPSEPELCEKPVLSGAGIGVSSP